MSYTGSPSISNSKRECIFTIFIFIFVYHLDSDKNNPVRSTFTISGEQRTGGNGRDATENTRKLEAVFWSGISRIFSVRFQQLPVLSSRILWQERSTWVSSPHSSINQWGADIQSIKQTDNLCLQDSSLRQREVWTKYFHVLDLIINNSPINNTQVNQTRP
jgi:hypothetical protein